MALDASIQIISPWRIWSFQGRADLIQYAQQENIPIQMASKKSYSSEKSYSIDKNIMHTSYEGGILEDCSAEPEESMFLWTNSPEKAPDTPEYVSITFEKGYPIAIALNNKNNKNKDKKQSPCEIMYTLNKLAAKNGIGRVDIVENRLVGIKSRGVYETPGGTILHIAHRDIESITIERNLQHLKDSISMQYAELVYNGRWFSSERESLQKFIVETQKTVNGTVHLKLYKGNVTVVGRNSKNSLYSVGLASFEKDNTKDKMQQYNPKDAEGFIKIYGISDKNSYQNFTGSNTG